MIDNLKAQEELEVEKIKVTEAEIVVRGTIDKPYYVIVYHEVGKSYDNEGFGSYRLENVFEWRNKRFKKVDGNEQPKTDWIPCEERLPEEHDGIYAELIRRGFKCHHEKCSDVVEVTLKSKEGKIRTTNAMTYDGKWDVEWESKEVCHNRIEKVRTDETVIAWIPKREPYKKEGAENE